MNDRRRGRRVTYRPSRASGVVGIVGGCIFLLIGILVAIPNLGAFGALWTAMSAAITGYNAYVVFGKKYIGPEIRIEDEDGAGQDEPEERLRKLRELYDQRLITEEEYEEKRKKILEEL